MDLLLLRGATLSDQYANTAAPGWYPDGSGALRYWNGQAWTEAPSTAAAVPHSVAQTVAVQQPHQVVQLPAAPMLVIPLKSTGIAYLWWLLLGVFGAHQFYLGKAGRGVLYLLTGGVLGIMLLVDLFTLPSQVRQVNAQIAVGVRR
jgi:TM2 domain/Protein of unknown function (DUF2510)